MEELFSDIPSALQNTVEIAKRCNVKLRLDEYFLPEFPIPEGLTIEEYFCQVSHEGLKERLACSLLALKIIAKYKAYEERLEIELDVINQMGFPGYFLIVADLHNGLKQTLFPWGQGVDQERLSCLCTKNH